MVEVRFGDIVFRNGMGYSEKAPTKAEVIEKVFKMKKGSSRASKRKAAERKAAERKAAERLKAAQEEIERKRVEKLIKSKEIKDLEELKKQIVRSNLTKKKKLEYFKQVQERRKYLEFQSKVKSGRIQGFSGTGLTQKQYNKRKFLIDTGILKKQSSATSPFTAQPLRHEYFISKEPTPQEKRTWNKIINDKINEFKEPVFKNKTEIKNWKSKLNIFKKAKIAASNINKRIDALNKSVSEKETKRLARGLKADKTRAWRAMISLGILEPNYTRKQMEIALFVFSAGILTTFANIPEIPSTLLSLGVGAVGVAKKTPTFIKKVANDPRLYAKKGWTTTKKTGNFLYKGGTTLAKIAYTKPGVAVGKIGTEYFLLIAGEEAFNIAGKINTKLYSKLSKNFKEFKKGEIVVRAVPKEKFFVRGSVRYLEKRVQKPSLKRPFSSVADFLKKRKPGQFKEFTKDPGLILKEHTIASSGSKLSKQAKLAGEKITAVNAAADSLTSFIRRRQIMRKPILAKEAKLLGIKKPSYLNDYILIINKDKRNGKKIARILKKFDNYGVAGKRGITRREFVNINRWLQKNVAPNITLLERSLYLDPKKGLRVSRLGIGQDKRANLKELLTLKFKLRGNKPQILVFENVKVAKFPKSLKIVERKLLKDIKLTESETFDLIEWQIKSGSGKMKPIGSTIYQGGRELEVTLAPGEMIRRVKKLGVTIIKGKKISIVKAEVYHPSKRILKLMEDARNGILKKTEVSKLEKVLSKKLGRRIKVETPEYLKKLRRGQRTPQSQLPVLRVKGKGIFVRKTFTAKTIKRTTTRKIIKRKVVRKPVKRKTIVRKPVKRKTIVRKPVKRKTIVRKPVKRKTIVRKPVKRKTIVRKPVKRKTIKPMPKLLKGFIQRKRKKKIPTYYIITRKRGRLVKLYPKPLILKDARDYLAYSIDNNLTKTAWFVPLGKRKNIVRPPKKISGYYSKVARKLRPYKIKYGKKKQLLNGYIEKRKYFQDTKGEVSQIKRLRRKKPMIKRKPIKRGGVRKKPIKRKVIRRKSIKKPIKRKVIRRKSIKRKVIKRKPIKRKVIRRRRRK